MFSFAALANAASPALMPLPAKIEYGTGALPIDFHFAAVATGPSSARLDSTIARLVARLSRQTGIPMQPDTTAPKLRIECASESAEYPAVGDDESYQLDVTPSGARITAPTRWGAMRGVATFAQLVTPSASGFVVPAVHVEDRPRFAWRGLMLDACRHWMPLNVVLRNLDAMAAVKLNVFHWHLSDDQGFRVESKLYPRLQEFGSNGHFYTQAEVQQAIDYARDRGIRVVPEFDIPGHTLSWFPGYPDLAAGPGPYEIGKHFGVFDPVMDPSKESTYEFLEGFLGEMARLFPDPYFHIGGDEVNGKQWAQSPSVQAFAKQHGFKDTLSIQLYFSQRVHKILEKDGKTMIGWDEILQPDLGPGTVIQTWRNQGSLAESVRSGYRGILSWGYYLDHLRPASYHYGIDPQGGAAAQLTPEQESRILGGEACMWSELVDAETVDSRIWPRAAAIAERFWSPRGVTDVASMYDRLEAVSRQLEWTGVHHRSNYLPMLDRLSGDRRAPSVQVLADAVQALGLGPRGGSKYTTETPLNRLVDAARPESESVRALEQDVGKDDAAALRRAFTRWAANDAAFQPLAADNALLVELTGLSRDLSTVGQIGLKALDYLASGRPAPADWVSAQSADLTRMSRPNAEVTLAAVRPVKMLLEALSRR